MSLIGGQEPPRNMAAAIDRILENQNRGITEMVTLRSRLHAMANFMQAEEQRILDLRDDIKGVMRTVESMHAENKITLATLQQQVEELGECKALLEAIQLEGKLAAHFQEYLISKREVANNPTPETSDGERHESNSAT